MNGLNTCAAHRFLDSEVVTETSLIQSEQTRLKIEAPEKKSSKLENIEYDIPLPSHTSFSFYSESRLPGKECYFEQKIPDRFDIAVPRVRPNTQLASDQARVNTREIMRDFSRKLV